MQSIGQRHPNTVKEHAEQQGKIGKFLKNKQPLILQQEDNYRESLSSSFHHHTLVSHINNSGLRTIHVTYCQGNTPHKHSDIKR